MCLFHCLILLYYSVYITALMCNVIMLTCCSIQFKCLLMSNKQYTSRVLVEGKSSVSLICMKYTIIFLISIIISLGQIILSCIANTSRTHARERVHAPTPPPTHTPLSPYRYSMGLCQPTVTARSAGDNSWSLAIEIDTGTGSPVFPRF